MAKWHFKRHDGFGDITQSSSAEAFEGSSLKGLATSLVRESIQNILDVSLQTDENSEPARVRFTVIELSGPESPVPGWFDLLMQHLQQPGAGIPDPPQANEPCRFLLIEDFNTSGLVGDYLAPYVPGTENNFVNFLYHDGLTGKAARKLGSRGVGKIVLLLASRARSLFAYTIRSGDAVAQPLLVGKSLLKFRSVDGLLYEPACYFLQSWDEGKPRVPVSDRMVLDRFKQDFSLSRSNETGLSVVIPYLDPAITIDELRRAIVEEYHFAILQKKLVVELSDGSKVQRIDANDIPVVADDEIEARVALARFAITHPEPDLTTIAPTAGQPQKLEEMLVPENIRQAVLDALNQRVPVAVRCHLHIHPKNADAVPTFCDIYLQSVENVHQRPVFMRDLLPISGEGKACSQLRSLVLIRRGPLADFLRAAEGANHTQWSPRTDNFKKAYKGRLGEIEFVSSCVNRLVEIARGSATEPVGGISTFYFSTQLAAPGGKAKGNGKKAGGPKPDKPEIPSVEQAPIGYQFSEEVGGFTLRGDPRKPIPKRITVRAAYDVLRGSPWSDYDPDDFDFRKTRGEVKIRANGAEVERPDPGNRLIIKPLAGDFEVTVSGFNEHLDLIVEHRSTDRTGKRKGATHAGQTVELHQPQ